MTKLFRSATVIAAIVLGILVLVARDTSNAAFFPYTLNGIYRLSFTGFVPSTGRLQSGVGIFISDGLGHITGTETFNDGALVCRNVLVTATYTMGGNGIGQLSADYTLATPGCSGHFESTLLLLDGGDVVRAVSSSTTFVTVSEEWRRQPE
jgi:hypothetical protein